MYFKEYDEKVEGRLMKDLMDKKTAFKNEIELPKKGRPFA